MPTVEAFVRTDQDIVADVMMEGKLLPYLTYHRRYMWF